MIPKNIRKQNELPILLFFILFLNYIPLFLINYNTKTSNAVGVKEMTICFGIECFVLIVFLFKKIKINKNIIIQFVLLLITTIIMFIIQIPNYKSGNYEIMDFANIICIAINIFLLFILLLNIQVNEDNIYSFFKGIIGLGILSCIVNIVLYHQEILGLFGINRDVSFFSIKSFFAHRNQFAIFLYISIISNIFMILKTGKKIYILTIIVFGINLIFTASRTGILCTVIFIFLFFVTTPKIKIRYKLLILVICVILAVLSFIIVYKYVPKLAESIDKVFIRSQSLKNLTGRTVIWKTGIDLVNKDIKSLIFGVGRFIGIKALDENVYIYEKITQFHSFYIDMLVTGGLMELLYLLSIYMVVVRRIIKSSMDKKYKSLYISIFISYAIYCSCESLSRFSIGCADTVCLIAFISIPLLHANSIKENIKTIESAKEKDGEEEK